MKKKRKYGQSVPDMPRVQRIAFMLNEEEYKTINNYLTKYKITNRSRWYRETILSHILKVLEQDYPTLFSENEMRR
ncbi:MAG: hypothetical protein LBU57_07200 [Dysgonamonadaceae bacterium]|jgi:NADH:ubiquinone oxidoreductase subunit D|nr:hypothetical protein [Dysgonamonadaceae bacterium]